MRNKIILLTVVSTLVVTVGFSQVESVKGKSKILEATNSIYLKDLSKKFSKEYQEQKAAALQYARGNNLVSRTTTDEGSIIEIQRISATNQPVFYKSFNVEAAITTGTIRLHPGNNLGMNLTGKGERVFIWDAGAVNEEHQELKGRVKVIDNTPFGEHDTHVAGTIGARGLRPEAQGMAYEVSLTSYDFNNDNAEMAEEAANGALISNHSYGLILGWQQQQNGGWQWSGDESISGIEDYRFGFYNENDSKAWDDIAYNAPYYLIVSAAGNDRSDTGDGSGAPADGPFDTIGPKGAAKNILTVGAVEPIEGGYRNPADVVMSSFSSWGPVDDGRVKPDIVAAGVNIFSSISEAPDAYAAQSGTSMAAPNVTGSLLLLQELYARVNAGDYMRSATLKGLAIHTAHQAKAEPGPSYEFGWGLLAADRAAALITREDDKNFIIQETRINNQGIRFFTVTSDGTAPLTVTLSWTDPAGSPVAPSLDPDTAMLVNDLDLRVFSEDSTYLPWRLSRNNPNRAATKGDNTRDNVEKIEIPNPQPGEYTIVVNHKGELQGGGQNFSIIISNKDPNVSLTNYYWIGNSGDWNDPSNWSATSGGAPANSIPDLDDPVIFDHNSFTDAAPVITLNQDAFCYNINWYADVPASFNLNGNLLNINGSIDIQQPNVVFSNGGVALTGEVSKGNYIRIPNGAFSAVDLVVNGLDASWNMLSDLEARSVTLLNGGLSAENRRISVDSIRAPIGLGQALNFAGSTISGIDFIGLNSNVEANFTNATIEFTSQEGQSATYVLNGAGKALGNVVVGQNANLQITGNNSFNKLQVQGSLLISGNNTIDSLIVSPQANLMFQGGTTQEILNQFAGTGSDNQLITIQGLGGLARLVANNEDVRFCFNYITVANVAVSGSTPFVAGENSALDDQSTGWFPVNCEDLLYVNFDVQFACEQGVAQFIDQSTGGPVSWQWSFDDPQFTGTNVSTERNPTHQFNFEGTYNVTLTVSNGETTSTRTKTITVKPSSLSMPEVLVDGDSLFSSVAAPQYQWYNNGEPIPGATKRTLTIESSADYGSYTVEVSNGECRFISEPAIINDVGEDLENVDTYVTVFPNPAEQELTIKLDNDLFGPVEVVLVDAFGQQVMQKTSKKGNIQYIEKISVAGLPNGFYILQIRINDLTLNRKIIKVN